jgi:hypothetical protein
MVIAASASATVAVQVPSMEKVSESSELHPQANMERQKVRAVILTRDGMVEAG